jgi:hypothetical protein
VWTQQGVSVFLAWLIWFSYWQLPANCQYLSMHLSPLGSFCMFICVMLPHFLHPHHIPIIPHPISLEAGSSIFVCVHHLGAWRLRGFLLYLLS